MSCELPALGPAKVASPPAAGGCDGGPRRTRTRFKKNCRLWSEKYSDMDDNATIQAVYCGLGLPIPGLHMRTRCLPNCTQAQMGPHTALADRTVRESIMTCITLLGCKCCGIYDRQPRTPNHSPTGGPKTPPVIIIMIICPGITWA
jgi:hypothetical protein